MIDNALILQHLARMLVIAQTSDDPRSDILLQIRFFMVVEQVFQLPKVDDVGGTDLIRKGAFSQVIGRTDIGQAFWIGNFITDDMIVDRNVIALLRRFMYAAQVLGERSLAQSAGRSRCDIEGDV